MAFFKRTKAPEWLTAYGKPEKTEQGQFFVPLHHWSESREKGDLYWDREDDRFFVMIESVADASSVTYTDWEDHSVRKHIYVRIKDQPFCYDSVNLVLTTLDKAMSEDQWDFQVDPQEFVTDAF